MPDDAAQRRADAAERAEYHVQARRIREEQEAAKAQVLVDRFVERATQAGLPTTELKARPWSGRGTYRTGVVGWYVKRDRSIGIGQDGGFYVLVVAPVRFGLVRTVRIEPTLPPLQVGKGARDGDSIPLDELLQMRFDWSG